MLAIVSILSFSFPLFFSSMVPHHIFVVGSESMNKTYNIGDLIVVTSAGNEIANGSVIVFKSPLGGGYVVHRIVGYEQTSSGGLYVTKGDANADADSFLIKREWIVGEVTSVVPKLGLIYFIPREDALVFIFVCVIFYALLTFYYNSNSSKRKSKVQTNFLMLVVHPKKRFVAALIISLFLFASLC
jgi:signal peptidase